ncbi:MAG: aminopeptidase P family protein [Bacteroidaceae bacterium]|nr:aminopeptidase P family protein [Bacteroidaceae bacterium]
MATISEIKNRLAALREQMQARQLSAFIVPSTDPHSGEYVPEHWESRKWICGFTGSAGTAVITLEDAGLWTDSRYFIQAEEQLEGTGIRLFKDRLPETPSITDWLGSLLRKGEKVGIDGWVNSHQEAQGIRQELKNYGLELDTLTEDVFDTIWNNRPSLPQTPVFIHDLKYTGCTCTEKIQRIQEAIAKNGASAIILSALDEIAWTLNLRGADVHCNPVFISYLLLSKEGHTLYILEEKIDKEVLAYLQEHQVTIKPYAALAEDIRTFKEKHPGILQISPLANEALYDLSAQYAETLIAPSPVALMKAVKNETEQAGFRKAMERDGVALVKFLRWLKEAVPAGNETELSVDRKLYEFRSEQADFKGISFDTIAGYKEHAAIVHYEATPETDIPLKPEGLLLLDSGAQYLDGTTDITRTIALGPLTEEEKTDYTMVLKGHLHLQNAHFPAGTCGTQLDVLARIAMWKAGINYMHGTGHGIGHFLCVHEGPHQVRMNHVPTLLEPGMILTDEPGIYKGGRHGIRTENTLLIVPAQETEFGKFYRFEPLTLCPIDKEAIAIDLMTDEELTWLNEYHQIVYQRLCPFLNVEEQAWLKEATTPLNR